MTATDTATRASSEPLERVLASARAELPVLRKHGASVPVDQVAALLAAVEAATEDFRVFLSEADAALRSGHQGAYWRARFEQLAADGHAELRQGKRYYRQCVIPRRLDVAAIGRRGVRGGARRGARHAA